MKKPRLTKTVWRSFANKLRVDVEQTVAAAPADFNADYLKAVSSRLEVLETRTLKVWLINLTIIGALFLQLKFHGKPPTILGFDFSNIAEGREILLIASLSLSLVSAYFEWAKAELKVVRDGLLKHLYPDPNVRSLMKAAQPTLFGELTGKIELRQGTLSINRTAALLVLLILVVFIMALVAAAAIPLVIQVMAAWQVLQEPKLPAPWNAMLVIWAIASAVGYFGLFLFRIVPLPHTDYGLVEELTQTKANDQKAYEELIRKIMSGERKP